jgi:hypothetical protein
MNNNKPTVKLKTIQFTINNKYNNILDDMTTVSKNIYNCCIYSNNIFYLFKNKVYQELYVFLKIIQKSELNNPHKKILIGLNNTDILLSKLKYYYDFYNDNKQLLLNNNNIIYDYIKNKATNIILNSINIEEFYNTTTNELSRMVNYTASNKEYVFTNIINKIIKSFYDKKYFLTKYQMLNNIPFKIKHSFILNAVAVNRKTTFFYTRRTIYF